MYQHKQLVANTLCPTCKPCGAYVLSRWIPLDIWSRIAAHLVSLYDLQSFRSVCRVARFAVSLLQAPREKQVCDTFHVASFVIPAHLVENVLMVHAVPPRAESLILFVDSESGSGIDLAWLRGNRVRRVSLGLETVPASAVSNIRFSPDGKHIACLVTLAHGTLVQEDFDPLHRLRGWETIRKTGGRVYDISYDPCEDCTVQIVDLEADENGMPYELLIHTFSHVFVPEYGFDMVWRSPEPSQLELAFVAMLHSTAGAATYLVRWCTFQRPTESNFVFMACIDGASTELSSDKRHAMLTFDNTRCTSRIEIARDASYIFFDTLSKFGILRFDQVEDASCSKVTRADLSNNLPSQTRRSFSSSPSGSSNKKSGRKDSRGRSGRALRELNVGNPAASRSPVCKSEVVARVSRMSPDGLLLCSVLCVSLSSKAKNTCARHVEMRSSVTGKLMYRKMIIRPVSRATTTHCIHLPFEKTGDIAHYTFVFSDDSELVVLWNTYLTDSEVVVYKGLPIVIQARSGLVVQDFRNLQSRRSYEDMQAAPDGQTLYGTRVYDGHMLMDVIDVLCGIVLKTVAIGEVFEARGQFFGQSTYLLPDDVLLTVSKGRVDTLWEATRGSLGCGWNASLRLEEEGNDV